MSVTWSGIENSPLPLGEVAPKARVRGYAPLFVQLPLTRIASQSDLSPLGRGESRLPGDRFNRTV